MLNAGVMGNCNELHDVLQCLATHVVQRRAKSCNEGSSTSECLAAFDVKHGEATILPSTCRRPSLLQHVSTCFDMFRHVSSLFRSSVPALKRARPVISNRAFYHSAIHLSRVRRAVAEPVCTTQPPGFGSGSSSHCEEGNPGDVRNSKTSKAK